MRAKLYFTHAAFDVSSFVDSRVEHSDSGEKNSIRFGSIHADESIFRFDSIRQFDKMDASIGVMIFCQ